MLNANAMTTAGDVVETERGLITERADKEGGAETPKDGEKVKDGEEELPEIEEDNRFPHQLDARGRYIVTKNF